MVVVQLEVDPLGVLSPREREILKLMSEGYSNAGICELHQLSDKTVEAHVRSILRKLDVPRSPLAHRRVIAVLRYLENA